MTTSSIVFALEDLGVQKMKRTAPPRSFIFLKSFSLLNFITRNWMLQGALSQQHQLFADLLKRYHAHIYPHQTVLFFPHKNIREIRNDRNFMKRQWRIFCA